ncbi:MAG: S41 family peptidase [Verrucomicrobiota bacterium]
MIALLRAKYIREFTELKITVLIDNRTASSAEALARILQLKCEAELIVERSFGKETIQSISMHLVGKVVPNSPRESFIYLTVEGFRLRPGVPVRNGRYSSGGSFS